MLYFLYIWDITYETIMGTAELKNKIIELLDTDNLSYLEDVFAFAEKQKETISDDDIVAYTVQGEPLTKTKIIENNKEAIKSIKEGQYKTHNEIRQKYVIK